MACSTITGHTYTCLDSKGGIQKIYIVDKTSITATTLTSNIYTAISLSGGDTFKTFQFETRKSTSTFTDGATITKENGSIFYNPTVQLNIPLRQSSLANKILVLAQNDALGVIIKDNNSKYWFAGADQGLYVSTLESESGIARTDFNGYKITLLGEENIPAYEVSSSIIASITS